MVCGCRFYANIHLDEEGRDVCFTLCSGCLCFLRHFKMVPWVDLQSLIVAFLCHLMFLQNIL